MLASVLQFVFANGTAQAREGPVQFEKDTGDDPFNIDQLISEASKGNKRYGIQEDESRAAKRTKVEDDD
jgi:SNW domain-containing protein 1